MRVEIALRRGALSAQELSVLTLASSPNRGQRDDCAANARVRARRRQAQRPSLHAASARRR